MGAPTHDDLRGLLHPAVAAWYAQAFPAPTPAQARAVPPIVRGESILLSSPTGSGKTLAGFLGILSELHRLADEGRLEDRVFAVYVSPLKALAHDVARNLEAPLEGISRARGRPSPVRVAMRTGETPRAERERMTRAPPHVLVTTPESLALVLLSPRLREALSGVRWVLVDEAHALAGTKRGAHLALALERLEARVVASGRPAPARVGMSATVRPLDEAGRFLTGGRPCRLEEVALDKDVDLVVAHEPEEAKLLERLDRLFDASRATLVFTNSRAHAERLVLALHERFGDKYRPDALADASVDPEFGPPADASLVAPHHGSMAKEARLVVEERLKRGELKAVVASSSLELGVHVDAADHVVLLGSPRSAARALQRVGRSGHALGATSRGTLVVADVDELPEAVALAALVRAREVEPLEVPFGGLDVLAQHLLAEALEGPRAVDALREDARRAWPYRDLTREDVVALARHLDERRLADFDEARGVLAAREARARLTLATQGGTIPDAGLVRVLHEGRYVGEVEEAFAEALRPGDVVRLAGRSWRVARASGMALHVHAAGADAPTVPAWRSEGIALSPLVMGATRRLLDGEEAEAFLRNGGHVCPDIQERILGLVRLQARASDLPRPGEVAVESVVDDEGRRALVLHVAEGRRVTEALGRFLAVRMAEEDEEARVVAADAGVALLARRGLKPSLARVRRWFDAPLEPRLRASLPATETFRRRFRHVAQRGLLLGRAEMGLGRQQAEATALLQRLLREAPGHPLLREAWREALEDALDAPRAEAVRREVAEGRRALRMLPQRPFPSPYAASILLPRASFGAPERREALADLHERAREWADHADATGLTGGAEAGRPARP